MPLTPEPPRVDVAVARTLARDIFGVDGDARPLPSERDANFLLTSAAGERHVLKIANPGEPTGFLEAQNGAMAHAAAAGGLVPVPRRALDGDAIPCVEHEGLMLRVRLLTWLPGVPVAGIGRRDPHLLREVGRVIGAVDAALASFDHPGAHRDFHWDLARGPAVIGTGLRLVREPALRALAESAASRALRQLEPLWDRLPRAVVHNDPNDHNLIVRRGATRVEVSGLIDFGDLVHSIAAADPAIATAYLLLDDGDPLGTAGAIAAGYHAARRLEEPEVSALFPLALLRLAMSVCIAESQTQARPGEPYLAVSQAPIARTLPALLRLNGRLVEAALRTACGFDAVPRASSLAAGLPSLDAAPVLSSSGAVVLDLSAGSDLVSSRPEENAPEPLDARIADVRRREGAEIGVGRYGEPRLLYASALFAGGDARGERRTVHLGIDLFAPAGTPVHAPLDAVVEALADNVAPLDYGPVVILRHEGRNDMAPWFTLYGHLSREVLRRLAPGDRVARGSAFASIGTAAENGGWAPHVHVQIVADLLDMGCDFPGVCRDSERALWTSLSPDPSPLLGLKAAWPVESLDPSVMLARRRARTARNLSVGYDTPLVLVRGWRQYLFDRSGRRFLDAYNNVPHVGHAHPEVADAVARQLRLLNTNTRYLHDSLAALAERLTATLPGPLSICYFVNSGSEANELALRLARAHTHARDLVVLESAYHGNTTTLVEISPYKFAGPGGGGRPPWVHVAPLPDVYRGRHRGPDAGARYAADLAATIDGIDAPLCGFIAETCPSVAGQFLLPEGYLAAAYRAVRAAGGVCIADEVQTGFGRLGTHFHAFEAHGVTPDIVVFGKPMGNGYPVGAVVTTPAIAASFDNGMEFFSTFGGSTASCVAAMAVLDVLDREALAAHADTVGRRLGEDLRRLTTTRRMAGDVRGAGLFWGVDLVRHRDTRQPATGEAAWIVNRLRDQGVLIGTEGPSHNVLKIRPPMPFDSGDAAHLVALLDAALADAEALG